MSETKNPPVADTLAMLGRRAAVLASQIAALRKRAEFTVPADRAQLAAAMVNADSCEKSLRFLELRARAEGGW